MDGDRFDELAKRMATGRPSRRRLLRGLGGTLAGGLLSGLGVGRAGAAGGGNSAAAQWCHDQFSGAAAGHCTSQAAQGTGPYYSCAGPGGTCTGGRVCLSNGSCALPCSAGCGSCGINRCIATSDGNVCSAGNAFGTCNQSNTDCPAGSACSGVYCEHLC